MAYAALVSLEQTTDLFLKKSVEYSISVHEREQIESIREYAIYIISFLENSPQNANAAVEGKIRDLAYEAEDLLEFFTSDKIQMSPWSFKQSRDEFKRQLKIVTEKIGVITGDMTDDRPCAAIPTPRVATEGKNDVVIGLDEDLLAIKSRLCGRSSKREVIPIVGMGGIGKTTLSRIAFNDPLILEYFNVRAWVTVSQDYCFNDILSRLHDSMKFLEQKEMPMGEKVYKCLKGKRYLIVLDDVWSTEAWGDVRNIFSDDNNGSRIMLTTRLADVAAYPVGEGSLVHEMKFMDDDRSWNLLKQRVFTNRQECPLELEDTGKEIARGCSGLPLAVVLVAGVLSTIAKNQASWEEIAKNVISVVDGQLEKILALSYTHLPHYLRSCFLYIGGFPEDYEIHASRLIRLWVAEGFLKSELGYKSLEEKAENCLEDLVKRNLVLVTRRKATGEIKSCCLHDLVRDLCVRRAQEEKFLHCVIDRYNLQKNSRRISTISHFHFTEIQRPFIRTFLCMYLKDGLNLPYLIVSFRLLRVLDTVCIHLGSLPSQLFEQIFLRYLALQSSDEIPASISNLQNLQTLIINSWGDERNLTLEIWRIQSLRHLRIPGSYRLLHPVDGTTLPLLQTFVGAISPECSKKILKMIPNLKKLEIHIGNDDVVNFQSLVYLNQLEKLKFSTYCRDSWQPPTHIFPTTLKKLTLHAHCFSINDMSIIGSLPDLQVLKLRRFTFHDRSWETTDGEFPQLRYLLIDGTRLRHWITESSHFPRLKCLVLRCCGSLKAIPDGIGKIPTLELIKLVSVKRSLAYSAKQIQKELLNYGNDTLQLRCL